MAYARQSMVTLAPSLSLRGHRPRRRRAAYSIWAVDKTLTMAATVACNLASSTTVGLWGQVLSVASGGLGGGVGFGGRFGEGGCGGCWGWDGGSQHRVGTGPSAQSCPQAWAGGTRSPS